MNAAADHQKYRWVICFVCMLLLFGIMGFPVGAFSIYQPFMIEAGKLTNAQGAMILTFRNTFSFAGMLLVRQFLKRTGIRMGFVISALGMFSAFFVYSVSSALPGFCVAASISGLFYSFGGMVPASILIDRWFQTQKGLAMGIVVAGTALASIVVPPTVVTLINRFSLQTAFRTEAFAALGIALLAALLIRDDPDSEKAKGDGAVQEETSRTKTLHYREPYVAAMLLSALLLGLGAFGSLPFFSMLFMEAGISATAVSFIMSLYGISSFLGKSLYGHLSDRLGVFRSNMIFYTCFIAGTMLACFTRFGGYPVAVIAIIAYGQGIALATVGIALFARSITDSVHYGALLQKAQILYSAASMIISPLPGIIADRAGSYVPAYYLFSAILLASFISIEYALIAFRRKHEVSV